MAKRGSSSPIVLSPTTTVSLKQDAQHQQQSPQPQPPETHPTLPLLPPPQPLTEPQILKSVGELDDLASAIQKFKSRFDELTTHLNFIQKSIDARTNNPTASPKADSNRQIDATPSIDNVSRTTQWVDPDLKTLCENTQSKALRRYIIDHLHDSGKLREELPLALRAAPNPALLVLDCVGRFYMQGKKAYSKDRTLVQARRACVLALESFLLAFEEEIKMDEEVRKQAEEGAVSWRKRLISEGALSGACDMDARGLLLLIGCFGIPKIFRHNDVWDLVRVSKTKQAVVRRSRALVSRITDILERMMKNGMQIEALEVVSAFGIEDKFPPEKILESFLKGCDEALNRRRREAKDNLSLQKEANEKQLAILKSALKYIEDRRLNDPMKLPLKEMIIKLDKENSDVTHKMFDQVAKRRANENEDKNKMIQETKRLRFTSKDLPVMSSQSTDLHKHAVSSHVPCNGSHPINGYPAAEPVMYGSHPSNGYPAAEPVIHGSHTRSLPETVQHEQRATYLDFKSSYSGLVNNYSTSETTLHGSGVGYLPATAPGKMAGGGNQMQSVGVGPSSVYDAPSGIRRETEVDSSEQIIGSNGQPNGWSGARDAAHDNRSLSQSFIGQPASGLFGPSTSIESFVGFPQSPPSGAATWTVADMYRFVDAVVEIEYGSSSNKAGPSPPALGTRHPSYMY